MTFPFEDEGEFADLMALNMANMMPYWLKRLLPRVPRDIRVSLVRTMTRILVDYGLGDLEEPDYQVLSDELCQTIRNRKETGAAAAASC